MKVFTANTTALLRERMEILEQEDHHGWRCIYLKLHDKQERLNAALRTNFINRPIIDLLARDEGYIYFCDDGDILIVFEGALSPVIAKLGTHFGDLSAAQLRGQSRDSMFSFFDLSKHWQGFMELCRSKTDYTVNGRERLANMILHDAPHTLDRMSL